MSAGGNRARRRAGEPSQPSQSPDSNKAIGWIRGPHRGRPQQVCYRTRQNVRALLALVEIQVIRGKRQVDNASRRQALELRMVQPWNLQYCMCQARTETFVIKEGAAPATRYQPWGWLHVVEKCAGDIVRGSVKFGSAAFTSSVLSMISNRRSGPSPRRKVRDNRTSDALVICWPARLRTKTV